MNNIINVAENRDKIMASQTIYCPKCDEKQFAPFDKLFTMAYGRCLDCSTPKQVETDGENIFAIIG